MQSFNVGEVWQVDLGMAAKVRPCLILTAAPDDEDLAVVTVLAHTTQRRKSQWELELKKPFLKNGIFHLQLIQTVPFTKLLRKLGSLNTGEMDQIKDMLAERFQL
ncbi:MAG: type II toxin-antitoxin system PemK/MazF family toxin [Verrucomicrobiota bacterium]